MDWIIGISLGLLLISVIYHLAMLVWIISVFLYEEISFRLKQIKHLRNKKHEKERQ